MNTINAKALVTKFLSNRPWMLERQIPVINEDKGDIEADISAAIMKIGAVAVVSSWTTLPRSSAGRTVVCESRLVIDIYEKPVINRPRANRATSDEIANYIAGRLNLAPLRENENDPAEEPLMLAKPEIREGPPGAARSVIFIAQTTIEPFDD